MAQVKIFEVRDRGTCIPVVTIRLADLSVQEQKLAARAGYGRDAATQAAYLLLTPLAGGQPLHYDPYAWSGITRTLPAAHTWLQDHFDEMPAGAVVDVRWILGEIPQPAESDL